MEKERIEQLIQTGRDFMKFSKEQEECDFESDQMKHLPQPELCKEKVSDEIISLDKDFSKLKITKDFTSVLLDRKSDRVYTDEPISLLELSYLLFMCQGVKEIKGDHYATMRTVPSGGARHAFETYLIIRKVDGLKEGKYHYLPLTHELEYLGRIENMDQSIEDTLLGQNWAKKASVIFYFSFVPYRCEWRYGIHAHRPALIDAGHVGQNLYLSATALNLGGCALAAFDDDCCDKLFGLDGNEEFVVYAMPIGQIS